MNLFLANDFDPMVSKDTFSKENVGRLREKIAISLLVGMFVLQLANGYF